MLSHHLNRHRCPKNQLFFNHPMSCKCLMLEHSQGIGVFSLICLNFRDLFLIFFLTTLYWYSPIILPFWEIYQFLFFSSLFVSSKTSPSGKDFPIPRQLQMICHSCLLLTIQEVIQEEIEQARLWETLQVCFLAFLFYFVSYLL